MTFIFFLQITLCSTLKVFDTGSSEIESSTVSDSSTGNDAIAVAAGYLYVKSSTLSGSVGVGLQIESNATAATAARKPRATSRSIGWR